MGSRGISHPAYRRDGRCRVFFDAQNLSWLLSRDEEMEELRSLSNPEEMDDTELLQDLRGLGKPPSFDGKDTMLINTAVNTRETFIFVNQMDRNTEKRFFHLGNKSSLAVLERE